YLRMLPPLHHLSYPHRPTVLVQQSRTRAQSARVWAWREAELAYCCVFLRIMDRNHVSFRASPLGFARWGRTSNSGRLGSSFHLGNSGNSKSIKRRNLLQIKGDPPRRRSFPNDQTASHILGRRSNDMGSDTA